MEYEVQADLLNSSVLSHSIFPFYLMSFPVPAIELNLACSVKFQSNIALRAKGSVFVSSDHRISLNQIVAFPIRLRQIQGDSSF